MASNILDFAAPYELNSTETKLVFDTVDNLLPLGLSKIAHLPQTIVVGDRSSGKSSVLEAVSNVRLQGTVVNGQILVPMNDEASMMSLVASYMKKPSSITLAVISAENELDSQPILEEAVKYDPARQRTLGVITKPDSTHPGSPKKNEYLTREAARNLGLGWHVSCNRKNDEDTDSREFIEGKMFKSVLWSSVPASHRRVRALQAKLRRVLQDHIKNGVPMLLEDIQENISDREVDLGRLGGSHHKKCDLTLSLNVAERCQKLVHDGFRGYYDDPFFGGLDGTRKKLRSQLRDLN
ncbi:Dynamin-B [Colletotrichum tropicale]|nr:Dynamin-B [Colletotrichum tropicale]